jgi:hypothetical protein
MKFSFTIKRCYSIQGNPHVPHQNTGGRATTSRKDKIFACEVFIHNKKGAMAYRPIRTYKYDGWSSQDMCTYSHGTVALLNFYLTLGKTM